ncbi:MAG: hypothetical protein E5X65_25680 [Mesorhizobium sp.]|nr:MAG: hypothetical protein E5X65_25680 [Mesorhizobium sp.]
MSEWNAEQIEILRKLVAEGLSGSQIGARMGRNRNSIIGKIHRLKDVKLTKAGGNTGGTRKQKLSGNGRLPARQAPRLVFSATPKPAFERPQPYVPATNLPTTLPISFLDAVDARRCLHYMGDPYGADGPDAPVCGAERSAISGDIPYCRRHMAGAYRAVPA